MDSLPLYIYYFFFSHTQHNFLSKAPISLYENNILHQTNVTRLRKATVCKSEGRVQKEEIKLCLNSALEN